MDDRWMITEDRDFIIDVESIWSRIERRDIKPILRLFEKEGYYHNDSHWGNFILGDDGKTYMIDFWRSRISPKK
ncbi:hypothetical protein CSA08_04535 [Candidatus Gracilibacteria bacterium]|nr:MAG: hypothetical protein CSA08_04535 [Candidatus Gracilibacteria bacterium]